MYFLIVPGVQAKEKYKGTFIYIPLDDRPVTYSYPVKNLQAAGYEILTPPEKYLASADRTGDLTSFGSGWWKTRLMPMRQ